MVEDSFNDYNFILIAASVIVSIITSFAAFDILSRVPSSKVQKKIIWLICSAIILGIGLWSMHFIGMLSITLPYPSDYQLVNVVTSLIIAVGISFISLTLIVKENPSKYQYIMSGMMMGFGIGYMHYIGMNSMQVHYKWTYSFYIYMFSIIFACLLSSLSFKEFQLKGRLEPFSIMTKIKSGAFLGIGITGLHYIAVMAANMVHYHEHSETPGQLINTTLIGVGLSMGIGIIVVILSIVSSYDRKLSRQSEIIELNEQYYKSLYEQNPDVILTFDLEGHFLGANQTVTILFGYTIEELINKPFHPLVIPTDLEKVVAHFEKAVQGKSTTYECAVIDQEGIRRDIRVTIIPIYIHGKITGVYGIIKDITEHKKAQNDLMEAESKYRCMVEDSLIGVYIYQDDILVYVNPKLCEMLGYNYEEIITLKLSDYIFPDDLELVRKNIQKRFSNENYTDIYQYRAIRKDQRIITFELYGSTIVYQGKKAIMGTVIDITERLKTEQQIKHLAYHDYLTGLPNRILLNEKLDDMVRTYQDSKEKFTLMFIDLDRFKIINDSLGHEIGDQLLIEISRKMKGCISEKDLMARYGGDEFTILLSEANNIKAFEVAQRIVNVLDDPIYLNHHEMVITPSIGIAIFPENGENTDTLIKNADLAMYYAKSKGKNNFQFFSNEIIVNSQDEFNLEMDLRKALERNELMLYYQPQVNIEINQIIGAEALIRWQHPEKGMISPAKFIPIAEETGLILSIGEWALRNACQQNKKWQKSGLLPITISVNISAKQFFQSNLADLIQKILNETGLDPKYLELEITESITMDVKRTILTLKDLKKLGVNISVDDFGTGYSSLNYLKEFPIDKLKIDQSFIRHCTTDLKDETITKTIISMAHNLNLKVIAEGVETDKQVSFLKKQLCIEAQGYHFSKPVPVKEFEQYLKFYTH